MVVGGDRANEANEGGDDGGPAAADIAAAFHGHTLSGMN
jgi:hypothetical protein